MKHKTFLFILIQALIGALNFPGCGSSIELASKWPGKEMSIDGNNDDWSGIPVHVENNKYSISACNDADYLYLWFSSANPQLPRQMLRGFTVWFDPEGGDEKTFGIKFPLGIQRGELPPPDGERTRDPEMMRKQMEESLTKEFEVLGPKKDDRIRIPAATGGGIKIKMTRNDHGSTVYEMRVPLHRSDAHPYAIDPLKEKAIGVGFETGSVDPEAMRDRMRDEGGPEDGMSPPREGGGPGFGRGSGRGPRGMSPNSGARPEPVKIWMKVTLADKK